MMSFYCVSGQFVFIEQLNQVFISLEGSMPKPKSQSVSKKYYVVRILLVSHLFSLFEYPLYDVYVQRGGIQPIQLITAPSSANNQHSNCIYKPGIIIIIIICSEFEMSKIYQMIVKRKLLISVHYKTTYHCIQAIKLFYF